MDPWQSCHQSGVDVSEHSIELSVPNLRFEASYRKALEEYRAEHTFPAKIEVLEAEGFAAFVDALRRMSDPARVEPGFVPSTMWWLVEGDTYHGRLSIRHCLNANLRLLGGHIGYDLRPSSRGRGLGTRQLQLGLEKARELGLKQVLLTCDRENQRSARVIEANGGELEDEIQLPGSPVITRRYWIDLSGRGQHDRLLSSGATD